MLLTFKCAISIQQNRFLHANLSVFPMTKICFSTNQVCCSYAVVAATATVGVDVVVADVVDADVVVVADVIVRLI